MWQSKFLRSLFFNPSKHAAILCKRHFWLKNNYHCIKESLIGWTLPKQNLKKKKKFQKKIGRKNKIKKTKLIFQPKLFPFPFSLIIKLTCNLYENNELCLLFKGKLSVILYNTGQTMIAKMLRDIKGINETTLFWEELTLKSQD